MVREHGGDGEIVVPPTIHALLQARIDSLEGDVRVVMERGSVEGEVFHRGAVPSSRRTRPERRRGAPGDARPQGADPLDAADLPRGRGLPLPPPAHPRRRVRVACRRRPAPSCTSASPTGSRPTISSSGTRSSATTSSRPPVPSRAGRRPEAPRPRRPRVRPSAAARARGDRSGRLRRGALPVRRAGARPPPRGVRPAPRSPDLALALMESDDLDEAALVPRRSRDERSGAAATATVVANSIDFDGGGRFPPMPVSPRRRHRVPRRGRARRGSRVLLVESRREVGQPAGAEPRRLAACERSRALRRAAACTADRRRSPVVDPVGVRVRPDAGRRRRSSEFARSGRKRRLCASCRRVQRLTLVVCSLAQGDFDEARELARVGRDFYRSAGMAVSAAGVTLHRGLDRERAGDLVAWEQVLRSGSTSCERSETIAFFSTVAVRLAQCLYLQGRFDEAGRGLRSPARRAAGDLINFVFADALEAACSPATVATRRPTRCAPSR